MPNCGRIVKTSKRVSRAKAPQSEKIRPLRATNLHAPHAIDVSLDHRRGPPRVGVCHRDNELRFSVPFVACRQLSPCTLNSKRVPKIDHPTFLRFGRSLLFWRAVEVRNLRSSRVSEPTAPVLKAFFEPAFIFTHHAFPPASENCLGTRRNRIAEASFLLGCLPAEPARLLGRKRDTSK